MLLVNNVWFLLSWLAVPQHLLGPRREAVMVMDSLIRCVSTLAKFKFIYLLLWV